MKVHKLAQGSDEWHQFRLTHFGASEAAAMLGLSTKMKRNELLHMKHTMQPKEFSDWVENVLFAGGHEAEELARPITENEINADLFPITCSEGDLSASCDGFTLCYEVAWEHKQWNEALAEAVKNDSLPDEFMPQCQQILMITKASELIFTCSDGTEENRESMSVVIDPVWCKRIVAGWKQFKKDLAEYVPRELTEKPLASAIMQLPALSIQIKGEVIASNLPLFKAEAETFIANINTELKTDDDFSNAEATVKYCDETEKKLEAAKKAAIAQTASIEEVMNTIDFIKEQLRTKRLHLEKKVKTEKANIKTKILNDGEELFNVFHRELAGQIDPVRLIADRPNFAAVMKNKRTLESLHNAVDTEISRCKILANEVAINISTKLDWFYIDTDDNINLFPDLQEIIYKGESDFKLLVKTRIADQKKKIDDAAAQKIIDDAAKANIAQVLPVTKQPETITTFSTPEATGVSKILSDEDDMKRIRLEAVDSAIDAGIAPNEARQMVALICAHEISHITIKH